MKVRCIQTCNWFLFGSRREKRAGWMEPSPCRSRSSNHNKHKRTDTKSGHIYFGRGGLVSASLYKINIVDFSGIIFVVLIVLTFRNHTFIFLWLCENHELKFMSFFFAFACSYLSLIPSFGGRVRMELIQVEIIHVELFFLWKRSLSYLLRILVWYQCWSNNGAYYTLSGLLSALHVCSYLLLLMSLWGWFGFPWFCG